jgi:hypothetical protein
MLEKPRHLGVSNQKQSKPMSENPSSVPIIEPEGIVVECGAELCKRGAV